MGKQHRRPWRGRGKKRRHIRQPHENYPGANTSTDQMVSPYGGLIPQTRGKLMKARYYGATVFVDRHTDFTYCHLMTDATGDSTLEAKNAYERVMKSYGHEVEAYHADNGRFAENVFVTDVREKNQRISYCGVGSHHQNGIAERRIKTLGEDARTMLAHGQHLWPEVVTKVLWPFAYKAACRMRNKFKLDDQGLSPEEKLVGLKMDHKLKNEHPLFCPVYVLNSKLQSGLGGIPKWDPRSNAGVYLGQSPEHSSDVALVLNLRTGLISPQYHVVFDDTFSTVDFLRSKKEPSNWETLCKFHCEDFRMDTLPGDESKSELLHSELLDTMEHESSKDAPTTVPSDVPDSPVLNVQSKPITQSSEGVSTPAEVNVDASSSSSEGERDYSWNAIWDDVDNDTPNLR